MRALLITPNIEVDGGVARHVRDSSACLAAMGIDCRVAARDAREPELRVELSGSVRQPLTTISKLEAILRRFPADVVHVHHVDDPAVVMALKKTTRVVISAHGWPGCGPNTLYIDATRPCIRANGSGCLIGIACGCGHQKNVIASAMTLADSRRRLEALRLADQVVCYSRSVRDHLVRNAINATVVGMPIPRTGDPREAPQNRQALFLGRLSQAKGVSILIDAMAGIPESRLTIAGDGVTRLTLELQARQRGVDVNFVGWLDAAARDEAFASADVVCMPHIWPEPFGLVGPEALMRARPVVASRIGGTGDWLQHGRTGIAVRAGHPHELRVAISELFDWPIRASEMGRTGRIDMVQRFAPEKHAAELRDIYAEGITAGTNGATSTRDAS